MRQLGERCVGFALLGADGGPRSGRIINITRQGAAVFNRRGDLPPSQGYGAPGEIALP